MTTDSHRPRVRAFIYCRMSLARFGDTVKTDEQERICREDCARRNWDVAGVFTDNSRSAWQRNRKRPDWDAMLAGIERGEAEAIDIYHGDRLLRQPYDLELLINLAYGKGIKLASPTGVRDLSNEDDLFILRIETAAACRESASTSRRKKGQYARMRRAGLVRTGGRGGRAFAFEPDGTTHVPAEVTVIKDAAKRILLGESTGSIARSITMLTPAGSQMTDATLRKMLMRPRYAGLMPDGINQAAWQPVLDRADWEMVRGVLAAKGARFGYATNARRWLLTGIAVCGVCGAPLQIRQSQGRAGRPPQVGYGCVPDGRRKGPGHVYRSAAHLDAYVTGRVVTRLANPANPVAEVRLNDTAAAELAVLTERRAEAEAFIASLADAPAGRLEVLNRALDSFDAKIAGLRDQVAEGSATRLRRHYAGISREEFEAEPLSVRRSLVRATFTVVVHPASRRGPGFRTEDVSLTAV